MKLSEIKLSLSQGSKIDSLKIEVKPYLSIIEKMMMTLGYEKNEIHQNGIVDECIEFKNNYAILNFFLKEIAIKISVINWYTNIELDGNSNVDDFDYVIISGIWDYVINQIEEDEYKNLLSLIDSSLTEKVKSNNSIEAIINRNLNVIADRIPNSKQLKSLAKSLIKDINGLDSSKLSIIQEIKESFNKK
jgi:hypothetical protein